MAFADSTKDDAYTRSRGRCQCKRRGHTKHYSGRRCPTKVSRRGARGAEFHHIQWASRNGKDRLSNCRVLCTTCHDELHALKQYT